MRAFLVAIALVLSACSSVPLPTTAPTATPDIQRSKLDIIFSGMIQSSYFKPSGKDLLTAALAAMRKLATDNGGKADVATPDFVGTEDAMFADFKKFAEAAQQVAAQNPRISSRSFGDAGIQAMLKVAPDCHTYYVPKRSSGPLPGFAAPLGANVNFRMLDGKVGYVQWSAFDTFVFDDVRKALDQLVAQGARSWIFDLRGNGGGEPPQFMASWFIKDGVLWRDVDRDGKKIDVRAQPAYYLPPEYQLPIAVIVDNGTGSSPEFLTVALQQRGRAKVFGTKSYGCLGSIAPVNLPDGSFVAITESVSIGPVSDTPINGVGIVPDFPVASGDPIEKASQYLRSLTG